MSICFNALMPLNYRPANSQDWKGLIRRRIGPATGTIIKKWRDQWCERHWELAKPNRFLDARLTLLWGPGGFAITISPVAIEIFHCSKWGKFLYDEEHRRELRASCFEFARIFGSDRAAYLPEMTGAGFDKCLDFGKIETELMASIGPPASSVDMIKQLSEQFGSADHHPGCYFIDRFDDLHAQGERK